MDWFASGRRGTPAPVESQYEKNPDRIVPLPDNLYNRATHDQEPNLEDVSRTRIRAVAQAAAFERCGMDDAQKRQLFERFGYPAAFMCLSSQAFAEMSAAREARCLGDEPGAMRHAKSALSLMEERDALDGRYASGRWSGWYDRDLIYPCRSVTARLRAALPALFAAGICGDRPSFIRGDRLSFDLTVTNAAVERETSSVHSPRRRAGGHAAGRFRD